jgi:hypothetical protein
MASPVDSPPPHGHPPRDDELEQAVAAQRYDPALFLRNARHFDLNRVPCAREALLQGAMTGATIGAVRFLRTRKRE